MDWNKRLSPELLVCLTAEYRSELERRSRLWPPAAHNALRRGGQRRVIPALQELSYFGIGENTENGRQQTTPNLRRS